MSITLDGTNGITTPALDSTGGSTFTTLSASTSVTTPLVTNAGTLALSATGANVVTASTNGAERLRITSAGSVGIGTSSPSARLNIQGGFSQQLVLQDNANNNANKGATFNGAHYTNAEEPVLVAASFSTNTENICYYGGGWISANTATSLQFYTAANNTTTSGSERMRIDASGNLLVGTTSILSGGKTNVLFNGQTQIGMSLQTTFGSVGSDFIRFLNSSGTNIGEIEQNGANTVAYLTSSDYRLKEDVQPMVGSVDRLMALKPVNFAWKADGSRVDGFIAHEAQEVVPECVSGSKDAVDDEGNPVYQGIDQSKIVPLLVAALQEALTKIEALEARVAALETNA
jgi:hypothetical protein